ncbi:MAG: aminotransferase class V-fold PLP-dependent enzyme [Chloroflexi bacterium]|nr:aminotransferase class V-fold PLP-dependent enzyme [Chloroflexota bacterium]MCY3937537.1 aminotransferase class V-fold PLP-dependent enzyme [Chloroflexota bacterium]
MSAAEASPGMPLESLRDELPMTREVMYFNTAMNGPTLDCVLKTVADETAIESRIGLAYAVPGFGTSQEQGDREDAARAEIASLLHCDVADLAITPNTAQAMHRVLRSIDWQAGDELCISSLEHLSSFDAAQALAEQRGVVVRTVPAEGGDGDFLEHLTSALSDRTRLVIVSEVTSPDGRRLPLREAADVAHQRGVLVVGDGAQSVGVYPVNVPDFGCDYYVGSGHKWLLGPRGTGFIWVSPDRIDEFRPDLVPDVSLWHDPRTPVPPTTARRRLEFNTYNHAAVIGFGQAARLANEIGLDAIEDRVNGLAALIREEVSRWKGVTVLTPMAPEASAGITTLAFDGLSDDGIKEVVRRLAYEDRVIVKFQWLSAPARPGHSAMRISTAAFNTEQEVDVLLRTLKSKLTDAGVGAG